LEEEEGDVVGAIGVGVGGEVGVGEDLLDIVFCRACGELRLGCTIVSAVVFGAGSGLERREDEENIVLLDDIFIGIGRQLSGASRVEICDFSTDEVFRAVGSYRR